jgi:AraC-like DNA-binding protein
MDESTAVTVRTIRDIPGVELWEIRGWRGRWASFHARPVLAFGGPQGLPPRLVRLVAGEPLVVGPSQPRIDLDLLLLPRADAPAAAGPWAGVPGVEQDPVALRRFEATWATLQAWDVPGDERRSALGALQSLVFSQSGATRGQIDARWCDGAVRRARRFIEEHSSEALSLDAVATCAGRSKFHLERTFAARLGIPIWEYVRLVRVERALELLRDGGRPADVCRATGFADQAHLTRSFRALIGITPGAFARSLRAPLGQRPLRGTRETPTSVYTDCEVAQAPASPLVERRALVAARARMLQRAPAPARARRAVAS